MATNAVARAELKENGTLIVEIRLDDGSSCEFGAVPFREGETHYWDLGLAQEPATGIHIPRRWKDDPAYGHHERMKEKFAAL